MICDCSNILEDKVSRRPWNPTLTATSLPLHVAQKTVPNPPEPWPGQIKFSIFNTAMNIEVLQNSESRQQDTELSYLMEKASIKGLSKTQSGGIEQQAKHLQHSGGMVLSSPRVFVLTGQSS